MNGNPSSAVLRINECGLDVDGQRSEIPFTGQYDTSSHVRDDQFANEKRIGVRDCRPTAYFVYKDVFARVAGAVLLAAAAPVIFFLMGLVRFTSRGPALYRQRRVGKNGREFTMLKLRTMYVNAEQFSGPVWCTKDDARVTPLGTLLRHLHLDELPQLWNVACGDMDLIGPRPERPEFVDYLIKLVPDYGLRHLVRPGITGLAQINLPPDETVECVHRKVVLDLEYIQTAGLATDLRILGCTVLRLCGVRHGRAVRFFRLERHVPWRSGGSAGSVGDPSLSDGVDRIAASNGRSASSCVAASAAKQSS